MRQEFADETYTDQAIGSILRRVKSIAVIGASDNPARPSNLVTKYLIEKGYQVTPVNPKLAGQTLHGQQAVGSLSALPSNSIDMISVFRASSALPEIYREAKEHGIRVLWMQLGVFHAEVAKEARGAGMEVIMNRCPKIEYGRLSGEIGWLGYASGQISAKRPKLHGSRMQSLGIRSDDK